MTHELMNTIDDLLAQLYGFRSECLDARDLKESLRVKKLIKTLELYRKGRD